MSRWRGTKPAWTASSTPRNACRARCCVLCRPRTMASILRRASSRLAKSGDLYDFLRYGSQQLGVALGDVSGKGSAAALYGAVAIGILRSLAPQKLQPAEMLRHMNKLLCERRIEGRFITLCFATWQKGRRKMRIANAGQSQPLLWKSGRCEKVNLVGFSLGIYDDVS